MLLGYIGHDFYSQRQQAKQRLELAKLRDPANAHDIIDLRDRFFRKVGYIPSIISTSTDNIWQRSEQGRTSAMLSHEKYDYIVLPVEQSMRYYDRVTRVMAARWVAEALRDSAGVHVMSPELALRMLGKRSSHLDDHKVAELAHRVGAKVVHILLGLKNPSPIISPTQRPMTRDGLIYVALTDADGHILKSFSRDFDNDGTRPCEMIFADFAPSVAASLIQSARVKKASTISQLNHAPDFPLHIDDMPKVAATPLDNAVYLQLVAMLTPNRMLYEKRRLFERSLLALQRVDVSSPYYNLLMARALYYLYRRPAALEYLSSAKTPAEKALLEFLNGNYPELAALVPKIEAPMLRAMSFIELKHLGLAYQKPSAAGDELLQAPTVQWSTILEAIGHDNDPWYAPDNIELFAELRGLFPDFDARFEDGLQGRITSGSFKADEQNFTLFKTLFDDALSKGGGGCCAHYGSKLEAADIWSLYHNIAVGNLLRQLYREIFVYDRPEAAKEMAERLEPWLQGDPYFMMLYARTLRDYALEHRGTERTFSLKKALDLAAEGITISGEVDTNSNYDQWLYFDVIRKLPPDPKNNYIVNCRWARCDLPSSIAADAASGLSVALPYENAKFKLLMKAAKEKSLDDAAIQNILNTRFNGAPQKIPFMADRLIRTGHKDKAISMLRQAIADKEPVWDVYKRLGEILIDEGRFAEASDTFMKYPAFKNPTDGEHVLIGNRAAAAADKLFWIGRYKEAMPLLGVTAGLDTGSGNQFIAIKYLSLIQGDYRTAIAAAYRQAQRYNSDAGFRDYLTILYLIGAPDKADAAFRELAPRFNRPWLWESLFVGQRMEKKSFDEITQWIKDYLQNRNDYKQGRLSAYYLARQAIMDRTPSMKQVEAVAHLEAEAKSLDSLRIKSDTLANRLKINSATAGSACGASKADCKPNASDPSAYAKDEDAGFLHAYALLKQGKFTEATDAFLAYDDYYPLIKGTIAMSALPYFAMAASGDHKSRELDMLASMLRTKDGEKDGIFDNSLTNAIIDADHGRVEDSLHELVMASRHCPRDVWRLVDSWYQLMEVAQWIYDTTGDERFIVQAVKWAKAREVIQPQNSWAYAFEARYGSQRSNRVHAAAFAEYLDPQSAWLAEVPPGVRRASQDWWPKHNPFNLDEKPSTKSKTEL